MTKPRPDQPGRCPSIDPHDTLQCTRAIHDDDQCSAGGIAWRKGSPRIEWDRERADRLQEEVEEYDAILTRQSDLLTRTVNALRGNPPPLTSWSHHDIPELAAEKVAEVARLTAELAEVKRTYTPCDLDLLTERDALAAQVAHLAEPGDPDARMDAYYYGFTRTGIGVVDNILSAVAKAGKSYHGTDMWGEELFGGGTCESRIQDAADAAAEQIRAALTGSTRQECVRVDPDPGHEDEGYSCVIHNCAWDECSARTDQEE